jgi:hypothetical protein
MMLGNGDSMSLEDIGETHAQEIYDMLSKTAAAIPRYEMVKKIKDSINSLSVDQKKSVLVLVYCTQSNRLKRTSSGCAFVAEEIPDETLREMYNKVKSYMGTD